ncbi:hypothetical protein [Leptolyngbya sp. FACHB-261]|uniref:hypothetical protein n=1 Tax=Leptolyngbya sp. FACHB-261 TaxID=2692806 RepID=UPI0016821617|nr:hypothetical protein [Leptolyngbya sp. FACHB-261]MBD2104123.1 hypothetical protein [Leptolyngbya sp. FACHB-261]
MTDPVFLTASATVMLAFQKFIESGAGEVAKKITTDAIVAMESLLKRIWTKLRGRSRIEEVKAAIEQTQKITPEQINQIVAYLQVAMDDDPQFANEIRAMAQPINAGRIEDNSSMVQNISDNARGWQTKVKCGTAYVGEIHMHVKES